MAGREPSAEQGGKGPNSRWRLPLTIEAGPVREVRGVEGLRLRAHYLINLKEGICVTTLPSAIPTHPSGPGGTLDRQRDSHQRKAQSCPGPVDCGQLLSQRGGHGASQVSWGEDGATAAGALVASRRCILGQLGSTFIEAGPVEEILGPMK